MKKPTNLVFVNTLSAIVQTLVYILLIAVLYRYIIDHLGMDKLGLWSVILSTTSLAGLGNTGIASGITKFIAQYSAVGDHKKVQHVLHASLLLTALISGIFAGLFYAVFYYALPFFLKPTELIAEARLILPYGFVTLFISSLAGIYLSALDGLHRIYLRSTIIIITTILYVALSMWLIQRSGLLGLAYAQVLQAVLTLVFSLLLLKKLLPRVSLRRIRWHRETVKEIFRYSVRLQFITILQLLTDPIMKLLLSKFGSIQVTAYYDMALKIINGIRTFIVAAVQSMVPEIAKLKSQGKTGEMLGTFFRGQQLITLLSMAVYPSLIGFSVLISKIWLGRVEHDFVLTLILVCLGLAANIISVPIYFFNLSTGRLAPNTVSALFSTLAHLVLGAVIGLFFSSFGVMTAWVIGSLIGTLVLKFYFRSEYPGQRTLSLWKDLPLFGGITLASTLVFVLSYYQAETHLNLTVVACTLLHLATLYLLFQKDQRILLLIKKGRLP